MIWFERNVDIKAKIHGINGAKNENSSLHLRFITCEQFIFTKWMNPFGRDIKWTDMYEHKKKNESSDTKQFIY